MNEEEKDQTQKFEQAETAAEHIALWVIAFRAKLVEAEMPEYLIERLCIEYLRLVFGR